MQGTGRLRRAGSSEWGRGGGTWGGLCPWHFHCSLDAFIKAEFHTQGPWPHPRVGDEGPRAPWGQTHMPSMRCPALRPRQAGHAYLGLDLPCSPRPLPAHCRAGLACLPGSGSRPTPLRRAHGHTAPPAAAGRCG